jgi:VWFA-related protein
MTRAVSWLISFVAAVLLATAHTIAQAPAPSQPGAVFRAAADAVTVDASVQRDGRPITGLRAADFELLDNGVPQEISDVAYEKLPIDVTMLLDVSASVSGAVLNELRRALREVRTDLGAADRLRLLAFNISVRRLVDFDQPAARIDEALSSVQAGGSSAVFDGLAVALTAAEAPGRRRLIVLFTDGQDSSSIIDAETLFDVARRSAATVAIMLGSTPGTRPASVLRTSAGAAPTIESLSERIAGETGGIVTVLRPGENLSSKFRRMVQEFRSSYVLYFTPRGVDRAGAHTIDVRVKRPGAEVRARRGYIWR